MIKSLLLIFFLAASVSAQDTCADISGSWMGFCTHDGGAPFSITVTITQKSCTDILEDDLDVSVVGALQEGKSDSTAIKSQTFVAKWTKGNTVLEWLNTLIYLDKTSDWEQVRIANGSYFLQEGKLVLETKAHTFALDGETPMEKDQFFRCEMDKAP